VVGPKGSSRNSRTVWSTVFDGPFGSLPLATSVTIPERLSTCSLRKKSTPIKQATITTSPIHETTPCMNRTIVRSGITAPQHQLKRVVHEGSDLYSMNFAILLVLAR